MSLESIDQVLYIASLGLRVHPLSARNKVPLLDEWTRKASTSVPTIKKWHKNFKDCNWGIATGVESQVFVVDIDPKHGGDRTWKTMVDGNKLPKTLEVVTGSRGTHYYFKYPTNTVVTNSSIGKGVDIRGEGGNIVIPPSVHPNGVAYAWAKGRAPDTVDIARAPAWLVKKIKEATVLEFPSLMGTKIEKGSRNNTIFHQALLLAKQGALFEFTLTAMMTWVKETKEFDISPKEVQSTVESAYEFYEKDRVKKRSLSEIELSDVGNARLLLADHKEIIKYAIGLGFHAWDSKRWAYDEEALKVKQLAIQSMDKLRDTTTDELKNRAERNESSALLKVYHWAISSHNSPRLGSMVDVAKSYPEILKRSDEMDDDSTTFMLNLNNGTLNLRTGELSPHNKLQFITRLIDHNYDPKAKCPSWDKTLELAFDGDKDLIKYFQRAIGYSISGDTSEQCFFICWGSEGNNGKSTMLEAVQWVLGSDYATMSDAKVVSSKEKDNHVLSSLAQLNKVRMVSVNEFGESAVLDEELIKQLTGGDTVQAKRLYMSPFVFKPAFKIWVRANAKPVVHGTGNAFWRRVKLIPFEHSIPEKYRRPRSEVDASLRAESEGIIAWAVRGFQEWQVSGLNDPQKVQVASAVYRNESDSVNSFFEECVDVRDGVEMPRSILYSTFRDWSSAQGVKYTMTSDKFTRRVSQRLSQFDRMRNSTGIAIWSGITLNRYAMVNYGGAF